MMTARKTDLIDRLPPARGRLQANFALHRLSWFRVGGAAEVLFSPADEDDLAAFLAARPADVPVTVLGAGSNLLIRDGGIDGVVIRLLPGLSRIRVDGASVVAGAGALDLSVAKVACEAGIGGLEFLSGVPGTIGGAVRMNAGAYGGELAGVIESASAIDRSGQRHDLDVAALGLSYRRSALPEDWIVTEARLAGVAADPEAIAARMAGIAAARETGQPIRARTGGSTFVNPPGAEAWALIDAAGCRGLRRGGAMVSEKHCNFLINTGDATAADIEGLGEEVRRRVHRHSGVRLEWEIRRIGRHRRQGPGVVS
ncbi:MAG: UDP-N-acetylmuramate dehydrogenase [Alphaproteobacteria bacterium]|jgi:UDP-N-acetylmuramate dehydrogenase|nr:UDP-N-acetylmuramate dehydrogenase [Alphaproteobacteria bacterium]MDP6517319.1 UDP-N-acetylmuramate dehydrogenase [Alphaproteobacteria bacterium]